MQQNCHKLSYSERTKLPVISGRGFIKTACGLGYQLVRQRGSHVKLRKEVRGSPHHLVVPLHDELDRGKLNGLINELATVNHLPKSTLIGMIRQTA